MDIATLRQLYKNKLLEKAIISPVNKSETEWFLNIITKDGLSVFVQRLRTKDDTKKTYKKIASAFNDAKSIGFDEVVIRSFC